MAEINPQDLEYVIEAHTSYATKPTKATRKWDGETPYYIHPLWCATTLSTETRLDEKTRKQGIQVLLYHDVLEDTTRELPKHLDNEVVELIRHMTFPGGSKQEMREIWSKPQKVKLYKLYDKVSNLLDGNWMNGEKRAAYEAYTRKLCEEVFGDYGELNITRIAGEITKESQEN